MVWHMITFRSLIVIYFTQLAKYPLVLYAKPSNKVYAIGLWGCAAGWGHIFAAGLTIMGLHFLWIY